MIRRAMAYYAGSGAAAQSWVVAGTIQVVAVFFKFTILTASTTRGRRNVVKLSCMTRSVHQNETEHKETYDGCDRGVLWRLIHITSGLGGGWGEITGTSYWIVSVIRTVEE